MTAQRILTSKVTSEIYAVMQDAFTTVGNNLPVRRLVWACENCGMVHSGIVPEACDSCGAYHTLALQQDAHAEINSRW